jgi:phosphodiesterase/alkaline phosphatase D-like protein
VDAFQPTPGSPEDAFIAKLNSTGSALVYSSYIGGSGDNEFGFGIAVDGSGNAYVAGRTVSTDFPSELAIQGTNGGGLYDAWVAKIVPLVTITAISPTSGKVGDSVTITGTNFDATAANNTVRFGGTEATVTAASATSLTATVPTGATFGPVSVIANNRTAESADFFTTTFSGQFPTIDASTLATKVNFNTATQPQHIDIGDIDGDGKSDMAVTNFGSNTVSVYRNTSASGSLNTSSFSAKVDFTTGTGPDGIAIGDLDADGRPDLAVVNFTAGTVSVLRNTATNGVINASSFAAKVDFSTGSQPRTVAIRDMDGDGKSDLVVNNDNSASVSVFRNTSTSGSINTASFATKVDFTTLAISRWLAIGDIDGDRKPEFVVTNGGGGTGSTFSVYRNTSTAGTIDASSFAAKFDFTVGVFPEGVAIGDLDGDGKLDLAVARRSANLVSVFQSTSSPGTINAGSFAAKVDFSTGTDPIGVAIGDLDGDGKPDLAVSIFTDDAMSVYRNSSSPGTIDANSFAEVKFATGARPKDLAIGDLDGDGKADIAVVDETPNTISVFHNLTPTTPAPTITSFTPTSAKPGDSVAITGTNFNATPTNNTVFLGGLKATVTAASTTALTATVPDGATHAPIDVFVSKRSARSSDLFFPIYTGVNQTITTGTFAAPVDFTLSGSHILTTIADLDLDGQSDIVVTRGTNTLVVFRNKSTAGGINEGSLAASVQFSAGGSDAVTADLDGDGKLDIAAADRASDMIAVLHNTSTPGTITIGSFASEVEFPIGDLSLGIAAGDLDLDGKIDLVATNRNDFTASVLRNTTGSGTIDASSFATQVILTTGTGFVQQVEILDIDGDGMNEIAVSNDELGGAVSVFRNTATPGTIDGSSFSSRVDFAVGGSTPVGLSGVDVDGDGKRDLVTVNSNNGTISILRNTATAGTIDGSTFATPVTFTAATSPIEVTSSDFDGDGRPDLAVSNFNGNVSLFKNTATSGSINASSLASKIDIITSAGPKGISSTDLDGDGRPDLAVVNQTDSNLSIFYNIADPPTVSSISPTAARVGKTVTITGTGFDATAANNAVYFGAIKANVATATATSLTAEVPIGATFSPLIVQSEKRSAASNNLFMPTFAGGTKTINTSTLSSKTDFATGTTPQGVALGDIDGDGKPDLTVANNASNNISVFRNTSSTGAIGTGSFATGVTFAIGANGSGVAVGDLDGDGQLDLGVSHSTDVAVFRNTSTSGTIDGSSLAAKVDFSAGSGPSAVAIGDLDDDGKADIAVANLTSNTVSVFRNLSVGGTITTDSFAAKLDLTAALQAMGVGIADIDGDGKDEIISLNRNSSSFSVYHNTTTPGTIDGSSFVAKVDFTTGTNAESVAIADMDGDGMLDVATSNRNASTVSLFRNTASSGTIDANTFAAKVDIASNTGPNRAYFGDFDGDGKPDLVVSNLDAGNVSLFRNTSSSGSISSSSFSSQVDFATGSSPSHLGVGDLDGDGRPDLAAVNQPANTVSVFRNQSDLETVGLSGSATVSPGSEVQLFRIGLVSYGSYTLNGINLTLSDLSSATGITAGDLQLRLYRSTDETFDGADVQIGTQTSVNIGTATTISPTSAENPVDHSFYIVTAFINSTANDGNAFKLGFAQNGLTTSTTSEGAAITASDGDNITVGVTATKWVFVAEPTAATHLQELVPQPGLEARDDNGNVDTNINGTVTLSVSPSGSLSQSTFTAANGVVPTGNVTISGAGSRTLIASGLGLTPDTTATFEVAKAEATVTFNNLLAVFDGNPKVGGATTDPPGLDVIFTHNEFSVLLDGPPTDPGSYGVTATVNDDNYQGSATGALLILLDEPPKAGFAATQTQGNPPLTVTFTDRSSGQVDTWFLEPGADDGRVYEVRGDSVTVTYSKPGTYTIFLTVRGGGFTDQTSLEIVVNGPPDLANIADATADEDHALTLDLSAIDAEGGTWSLTGTDNSLIASHSIQGDSITFTPITHANGSDLVRITRTNVHGLTTSQDVTLSWTAVDDPPTIEVADPATGAKASQEVTLVWTRVNDAPSTPVVGFPTDGMTDTPLAPLLSWSARDVDFDPLVFDLFLGPTGSSLVQLASGQEASSYSSSELSPGTSYTWKVVAHDPAGATAEASFTFTTEADLRAPLVSNVRAAPTESLIAFNWTTDEPATSSVQLVTEDGGAATTIPNPAQPDPSIIDLVGSDLVQQHQLTAINVRAGTWFAYTIRSTDALSNESGAYTGRVLTLSAPDVTAPLILVDPYIEGATTESAVVRWRTDEAADSRVRFSRLAAAKVAQEITEVVLDELTEDHLVELGGLEIGAEYSFEAQSADAAGNLSEVRIGSFATGIDADATPPEFTAGPAAIAITDVSALIALEADELVGVQVRFDSDEEVSDGRLVSGFQAQSEHKVQLLDLEPSTRYYFQVLIRDASGNETRSARRDFDTRAAPDMVAAEFLAGPAVEGVSDRSAVVVLFADEPLRVQLLVSTDPNLDDAVLKESNELQMSHTLQLTNLDADTDYFYEVMVRDGANNQSIPAQGSFHTLSEGETLPPEIVELFAEGIGLQRATVIWRTSEPTTGSLRFEVDAAAKAAASAAGGLITIAEPARRHRVQITQLQPNTRYGIRVFALDAQGNGVERFFSLRTLRAADERPPLIETGPNVLGIASVGAVIEVTYNEPVELELSYATNPDLTDATTVASLQRQRPHRVELASLQSGTSYWVSLEARDQSGNSASAATLSFTTDVDADQLSPAYVTAPFATDLTSTFARVRLELDEPASVDLVASTEEELSAPTHNVRGLTRRQQHELELTRLRPGTPYFFQVTAEDAGGNQTISAVTRFTTLSRTLQPVQLTAGPVAQRVGDRSASIFFRLDRAAEVAVTYYPVNNPENEVSESRGLATEHNVVLTNLIPAAEYAYAVALGAAGETSGRFRTEATADIKPPKFFGPPVVVDRKHDRVRIEWDTDEVADSEILFSPMNGANAKVLANRFDPAVAAKILAENGGERVLVPADVKNHVVVLINLTPGTRFLFESFCTDPAGNRVQWPVLDFLTSAGPDIAPPVMIGRPIVRGLTESSFLVAFTTNEPTMATLRSADGSIHLASGSQETAHELRVVGLEAETTYALTVCATDASGNGPTCEPLSVATRAAGDQRAPRINTGPIVVAAGAEEAVVELTTDEPTAVTVRYQAVAGDPAGSGPTEDVAVERTVEDPEFLTFHRVVLSGLEPGASHEYVATVADVAGNATSSSSQGFTTDEESDRTAPAITSGPSFQGITETSATIVWTTDEPASSLVDWSIDPASAKVAAAKATAAQQTVETFGRVERGALVQQHRLTLADLRPGTTYHIVVTSNDLSSNSVTTDPAGTELFSRDHQFTTRGSRDTEAPTFAVNPTVTWTNSTAVVAWGTNERAASRIDWRGGGELNFVEDNTLVLNHSLAATGLKPRTAYRFMITAEDQAGNKLTWGSLDGPMKLAEGAAKILQPPGGAGLFVTANVADSFVLYGPTDELGEVVGSAQDVTQHAVTITNLDAAQKYFYKVASTDPSENGATESTTAVVSTAAEVDLVPPRFIEEPAVAASTDDEIVLSWRTDEAAAARIEYESTAGEMVTRYVDRRQTSQQLTVPNLDADTEYDLSIFVNDASQNETPEPFLLRAATDAEPDLEPPRILSGPEVRAITDRSASIVWTTDELADSYIDYHTTPYLGSVVGSPRYTFEHEVMLTNLEPDSTYYFRVGSTDRANNGPTATGVAEFSTLEAPDTVPPAPPTDLQVMAGFSSILLEWAANDEDDLGDYSVYRETESGTFGPVATQLEEPRFVDENLEEGVVYRYRVAAVDQENPPNESGPSEIAEGTPKEANVPGAPTILGLEQGATPTRPILVIQNAVPVKAEDVLTYTVQVSTNTSFRAIVARGGNIAEGFGGSTRWRVGKALIPTARYWWRARASYGPFDGLWSQPVRLRPNQASVPLTSEDFDGDGAVSFSDFFILANGFGSGDPILDLDRDGIVGRGDLHHLKQKFGTQVASKLLYSQGAEVAEGSAIDVEAEATGDQVRLRLRFAGVSRLSGYGLSVVADSPILRYVGRVDSAFALGNAGNLLSLTHETGNLLHIADHLRGRVAGIEVDEGMDLELLFALDGPPQNVELFVQEGFLGRGAARTWTVETVGRAKVVPRSFALYPNYPNPFNPSTVIPVGIPEGRGGRQARLRLYNVLGQVVCHWNLRGWQPGFHRVTWDGTDQAGEPVASGIYLVSLTAANARQTRKLLLLR